MIELLAKKFLQSNLKINKRRLRIYEMLKSGGGGLAPEGDRLDVLLVLVEAAAVCPAHFNQLLDVLHVNVDALVAQLLELVIRHNKGVGGFLLPRVVDILGGCFRIE